MQERARSMGACSCRGAHALRRRAKAQQRVSGARRSARRCCRRRRSLDGGPGPAAPRVGGAAAGTPARPEEAAAARRAVVRVLPLRRRELRRPRRAAPAHPRPPQPSISPRTWPGTCSSVDRLSAMGSTLRWSTALLLSTNATRGRTDSRGATGRRPARAAGGTQARRESNIVCGRAVERATGGRGARGASKGQSELTRDRGRANARRLAGPPIFRQPLDSQPASLSPPLRCSQIGLVTALP